MRSVSAKPLWRVDSGFGFDSLLAHTPYLASPYDTVARSILSLRYQHDLEEPSLRTLSGATKPNPFFPPSSQEFARKPKNRLSLSSLIIYRGASHYHRLRSSLFQRA